MGGFPPMHMRVKFNGNKIQSIHHFSMAVSDDKFLFTVTSCVSETKQKTRWREHNCSVKTFFFMTFQFDLQMLMLPPVQLTASNSPLVNHETWKQNDTWLRLP